MGQNDGFSKHCKNHIFCLYGRGSEVITEQSKILTRSVVALDYHIRSQGHVNQLTRVIDIIIERVIWIKRNEKARRARW